MGKKRWEIFDPGSLLPGLKCLGSFQSPFWASVSWSVNGAIGLLSGSHGKQRLHNQIVPDLKPYRLLTV